MDMEQVLRSSSDWAERDRAGRLLIQALAAQEKYRDALARAEELRNNSADPDSIGFGAFHAALMEENGAKAEIIDEIKINGVTVSSTAVRAALCRGDVEFAEKLTGRPFSVTLPVIHGRRIGTGLGFPTINQAYPDNLTELRRGVYVCRVQIDGKTYKAVTNVGVKPTVRGDGVSIETHIIGYDGDLYGRDITVSFYRFLRDEIKFDSLEALKKQIEKDRKKAGEIKI